MLFKQVSLSCHLPFNSPAFSTLLEAIVGGRNSLCLTEKVQGLLTCLVNSHGGCWWEFWLISCGICKTEQMCHGEMHFTPQALGESPGSLLRLCVLTYLDWTFNSVFCKTQVSWPASRLDNYIQFELDLQSQAGTRFTWETTVNKHLLWKSYYGKFHSSSSSPLSSCLAEFILSHLMGKLRLRERLGIWPRPHMTKWLNWDSNIDISDPKACVSFPLLYSSFRGKMHLTHY